MRLTVLGLCSPRVSGESRRFQRRIPLVYCVVGCGRAGWFGKVGDGDR